MDHWLDDFKQNDPNLFVEVFAARKALAVGREGWVERQESFFERFRF